MQYNWCHFDTYLEFLLILAIPDSLEASRLAEVLLRMREMHMFIASLEEEEVGFFLHLTEYNADSDVRAERIMQLDQLLADRWMTHVEQQQQVVHFEQLSKED